MNPLHYTRYSKSDCAKPFFEVLQKKSDIPANMFPRYNNEPSILHDKRIVEMRRNFPLPSPLSLALSTMKIYLIKGIAVRV